MSDVGEPLAACVIVNTGDRRARELATALERRGATVRQAPALSVVPHLDDERLMVDTRAVIADPPDVVVATTGVGFRGWLEAADAFGLAEDLLAAFASARLIARGPKARGAIQAAGLAADWVAESETAAEIREFLVAEGVAGSRIAVQHHGNGSDGLDEAFEAAGATVASVVVYGWGPPVDVARHVDGVRAAADGKCDGVVFTSAPGAVAWLETVDEHGLGDAIRERNHANSLVLATVGPVTAEPLQQFGLDPIVPDRWRLGALVRSLVAHFATDDWRVDTVAGELVVRQTDAVLRGAPLGLSPSGRALLEKLVDARGDVVSHDALARLLPGDESNAHALEAAVARLRAACGSKEIIRTVVKRGYALGVAE